MKKELLITAILFVIIYCQIIGQTCPPSHVFLYSQAEIDAFKVDYPDCTQIAGNLEISQDAEYITDLSAFEKITHINGNLLISYTRLSNLNGLEQLETVGGLVRIVHNFFLEEVDALNSLTFIGWNLIISNNESLKNLEGFINLEFVNGEIAIAVHSELDRIGGFQKIENIPKSLIILGNDKLRNLEGFERLKTIEGDFDVRQNDGIQNFIGLESLETINGLFEVDVNRSLNSFQGLNNLSLIEDDLLISRNESLDRFSGLEELRTVNGRLRITKNDLLRNLKGLEGLQEIGESIVLFQNKRLENLNGLEHLDSIGSFIHISENPALTNLDGLENFNPSILTGIYIAQNPFLTKCATKSICDYLEQTDVAYTIEYNASNCNSIEEVQNACTTVSTETFEKAEIQIYPNPTKDYIHIDAIELERITIRDSRGKIVKTIDSHKSDIDISRLNAGIYFVEIRNKNKVYFTRIIKMNS